MSVVPISRYITIAKISQYLAQVDVEKNKYFRGRSLDARLPRLLYMERKGIEYIFAKDPTNATLPSTANYLYALCGKYGLQAQNIIGQVEGFVVNPTTGTVSTLEAIHEEWTIGINAPISAGATEYILNYSGILPNSVSVELVESNLPEDQTDQFSYDISYNADYATITFMNDDGSGNAGVIEGMLFIIRGLRFVNAAGSASGGVSSTTDFYQALTVATYADAVAAAHGAQKRIITILADEQDGTGTESKYFYEGNDTLGDKFAKNYVVI